MERLFAVVCVLMTIYIPIILFIKVKPILKKEKEPILQSIREGLKFVVRTPTLLGAQLLDMLSNQSKKSVFKMQKSDDFMG